MLAFGCARAVQCRPNMLAGQYLGAALAHISSLFVLPAQGKGAVGRFFSELTRQGSLSELTRQAELARQPSISAALAAAGMGGTASGRSSRVKPSSGAGASREAQSSAGFAGGLKQVRGVWAQQLHAEQ
jgi:hypothetical protein